MITSKQKNKLKSILGERYTTVILDYFEKNDINLPNGDPYTADYIRVVMNGRENERLEIAIYNAVSYERLRKLAEQQRRRDILHKKPDAVTPG